MAAPERSDDTSVTPAPVPEGELERLRRAMYGPEVEVAAAEYRRLQAGQAAPPPPEGPAAAPQDEPSPDPDAPVGAAGHAVPAKRSRWSPAMLAAATAVIGFAAGLLVAPALGGGAGSTPIPTPTAAAPLPGGVTGTGGALALFGERQRETDRPPIPLDARLLSTSFRKLRSVPTRGVDIYAAQDSAGDVCLVALSLDARLAVACIPIAQFRRAPVRLAFTADRYRNETATTGTRVELEATWGFLGRFDLVERSRTGE